MTSQTVRACAKLNLSLDVVGRRTDGYHELTMVMQSVDLTDTVTVSLTEESGITVSCGALSGPDNLAYRAAKQYLETAGLSQGVHVEIDKAIPVCGGLGGGSADAAAVLTVLNRLLGARSDEELTALASTLGADVPFACVGGTVLAQGIGERLQPISALTGGAFLLVSVGEKPSTAEMYARLDAQSHPLHPNTDALLSALKADDLPSAAIAMANAFSPLWQNDETEFVRQALLANGALGVSLSGAGPTWFGVFADDATAKKAQTVLPFPSILCHPTKCSILE